MCGDNPRLTAERAAFIAEHATQPTEDRLRLRRRPAPSLDQPGALSARRGQGLLAPRDAPTLWVAGRDSVLMKPFAANPDGLPGAHAALPRCAKCVIDDCGHNLHHDQPEQLAARLGEFFAE
jgi:pimeloyl-ACP methyl ester carboxylesterase